MTRIDARPGEVSLQASDAQPAPVDAAASAAEGAVATATEPKVKKGPPKKIDYPGLAAGKLEEIPANFNPAKHTALKEDDFVPANVDRFYSFKANEARRIADKWEDKAKRFKAMGGIADKKTAMKLQSHLEGLKAQIMKLAAQGDVSGLTPAMLAMVGLDAETLAALAPPATEQPPAENAA
jgi:hypothetical protein